MSKQPHAFSLRLPPDLMESVRQRARALHRTATRHIEVVLRDDLATPLASRETEIEELSQRILILQRQVSAIASALGVAEHEPAGGVGTSAHGKTSLDVFLPVTADDEVRMWRHRLIAFASIYGTTLLAYYTVNGVSPHSRIPARMEADRAAMGDVVVAAKRGGLDTADLRRLFAYERDQRIAAGGELDPPTFEALMSLLAEGKALRDRLRTGVSDDRS